MRLCGHSSIRNVSVRRLYQIIPEREEENDVVGANTGRKPAWRGRLGPPSNSIQESAPRGKMDKIFTAPGLKI